VQKTYILDTNILLHNPQAIHAFDDNDVVIPLAVIEEIDHQKSHRRAVGLLLPKQETGHEERMGGASQSVFHFKESR